MKRKTLLSQPSKEGKLTSLNEIREELLRLKEKQKDNHLLAFLSFILVMIALIFITILNTFGRIP